MSSAGTATDADCPVSSDLLEWADVIVVMEARHARQLRKKFVVALKNKRVVNLDIPDTFELMQAELVQELVFKQHRWMG